MIELDAKNAAPREALVEKIWGSRDIDRIRDMLGGMCTEFGSCNNRTPITPCGQCCFANLVTNGDNKVPRSRCLKCDNPCGGIVRLEELYFEGSIEVEE